MAKFCTECGKEIKAGSLFCTECGTKAPGDPVNETAETKNEAADTVNEAVEAKAESPDAVVAPPQPEQAQQPQPQVQQQPQVQTQPQVQQQPQVIYQTPAVPQAVPDTDRKNKVVGTGAYFGLMFLFALPIIGFIVCIIMCFAPKNKNLKHFARATLIWAIIGLVIGGLIIGAFYLMTDFIMDNIKQFIDGKTEGFSDLFDKFGNFGNLSEIFGDPSKLMEQFQSAGTETLPVE